MKTTLDANVHPTITDLLNGIPVETTILHSFSYDTEYIVIPGCPAPWKELANSGFTDEEIETAWVGFFKFAQKFSEGTSLNFSKKYLKKFNVKNDFIAIGDADAIKVTKTKYVEPETVLKYGYEKDENLIVPFTGDIARTAYFHPEKQTLICLW
jgi:hypothetical protein